jgi:hypothetical protein
MISLLSAVARGSAPNFLQNPIVVPSIFQLDQGSLVGGWTTCSK